MDISIHLSIYYCGIFFLTSKNVGEGELLLKNKKYLEEKFNKIQKTSILKKGDSSFAFLRFCSALVLAWSMALKVRSRMATILFCSGSEGTGI
jgi:hypothetical protein